MTIVASNFMAWTIVIYSVIRHFHGVGASCRHLFWSLNKCELKDAAIVYSKAVSYCMSEGSE